MPVYKYRAKRGPDSVTEGIIDAENREEAIEKINQLDYVPIHIEEHIATANTTVARKATGRIKSRDVTIFSRQLSSLTKSGIPILRALRIISEQSENPHFKSMLSNIHNEIKEGKTFSSTLASYPNVFSKFYIAMVRTGEDSGTLEEVLLTIAGYRQQQEEFLSKVRTALAYPVLMAVVGIGTVVFMLTFVMPRLMQIFANLDQILPLPTRILIAVSSKLRQDWFWVILVIMGVFFVLRQQAKAKGAKIAISRFKLSLPLFGKFFLKTELVRFSRSLELMIRSGIPILRAIDVSIPVLTNEIIRRQLL
ncbi:MAG: type II secretion system F family protein, partial [Candidatus Omnitrophota bacterium]